MAWASRLVTASMRPLCLPHSRFAALVILGSEAAEHPSVVTQAELANVNCAIPRLCHPRPTHLVLAHFDVAIGHLYNCSVCRCSYPGKRAVSIALCALLPAHLKARVTLDRSGSCFQFRHG